MRTRRLVRFTRPFEQGSVNGYVLDVGREFFVIALVSDHIRFDGFQALRVRDVRGLSDNPFAVFVESALKKRREHRPRKPMVNVRSLRELLLSAGRAFPLITIHREKVDASVCHVGRLVGVAKGRASILEIGPGASWDEAPTAYALKQITRVDFGGDYEDALHIVGGDPPQGNSGLQQTPTSRSLGRRS